MPGRSADGVTFKQHQRIPQHGFHPFAQQAICFVFPARPRCRKLLLMTVNKYIIYVEDDPDDLLLMQEAFREINDYELLSFENGAALLQFLHRSLCFPSLIILDINMPILNGRETLRCLKQHPLYHNIPVVLFSTGNNPAERLYAEGYHTDLVVKPYDFASLRVAARKLMSYMEQA